MLKKCFIATLAVALFANVASDALSQVVQFRLETTDMSGTPVDTVTVGDDFMLKTYTQHVGGYSSPDFAGVFAAYLDIMYDDAMTSVVGDVDFAELYSTVTSGDLSTPGMMDNIGGLGVIFPTLEPLGIDEKLVFSVPMRAEAEGIASFVGADAESDIQHPVLVYGSNAAVPAKDVDFGAINTRLAFDSTVLSVVPEPSSSVALLLGLFGIAHSQRRRAHG